LPRPGLAKGGTAWETGRKRTRKGVSLEGNRKKGGPEANGKGNMRIFRKKGGEGSLGRGGAKNPTGKEKKGWKYRRGGDEKRDLPEKKKKPQKVLVPGNLGKKIEGGGARMGRVIKKKNRDPGEVVDRKGGTYFTAAPEKKEKKKRRQRVGEIRVRGARSASRGEGAFQRVPRPLKKWEEGEKFFLENRTPTGGPLHERGPRKGSFETSKEEKESRPEGGRAKKTAEKEKAEALTG